MTFFQLLPLPTMVRKVPLPVAVPVTNSAHFAIRVGATVKLWTRPLNSFLGFSVSHLSYFHLLPEPGPTTTQYPGLKCAAKSRGLWGVLEICLAPVELVRNPPREDDAMGIRFWRALLTNPGLTLNSRSKKFRVDAF